MPPKKQKANGFMVFTLEWKQKYGRGIPLHQATQEAGKLWANMDATQRAPYNDKAKEERMMVNRNMAQKLTCTGMPISQLEKERMDQENKERLTKREIETTVSKSLKSGTLESQSYYFIMVNYFTKTLKGGVYVPAEISVSEFSLKDGVNRIYHTLINPSVNIYGHQYEAQHHSQNTHNLPLPPNALGDKNLGNIYNDVLNFIRDKDNNSYPPVYTDRDSMHVVESVLEFLKADVGANNVDLKVYPIQYLFFIMKEATCEAGDLEKPKSFYITDAYFERDSFEFQIGIACQFHEDNDRCKYCTQSYVTRWGYIFADYMCRDIAIPLKHGRHCPMNTNLNAIITPAPSTFTDTESFVSMGTSISNATKPIASSKIYYDNDTKTSKGDTNKTYAMDFPSLGERNNKKKSPSSPTPQRQKASRSFNDSETEDTEDYGGPNPWNSRTQSVPRQPDTSHFDIDFTKDDDLNSDADDFSSVTSFGRGRGSLINASFNTTTVRGHGRVRSFRP